MKVLQISSAQSFGGGERHLADLANGLAGRGHEVFAALRPNSPLIGELKQIPYENIATLPLRNALDTRSARDLFRLVHRHQIEIVHAHMARDYTLAAYASRRHARVIVTRHVLFGLNRLHRITLSRAARVIAVSGAVASKLREDGVVKHERISVVYNGIDVDRFLRARERFNRAQFLAEWKLSENSLLVGTVGELTPLKGHDEFLESAALIAKNYPNAYFVVAGLDTARDQKNRRLLNDKIKALDLIDRVRVIEWVEDISQLYCALDVFVSASHMESFGLAIAEAMACSTAVVATETEGAREIVRSRETGLLVPVGEVGKLAQAIVTLLNEKDERIRIGQAARQAISTQFSLERMLNETEKIYAEVLSRKWFDI
ncbi:MAG: glycosyltransferase family 4 protein [Pyrinomonadaceae bacterium]